MVCDGGGVEVDSETAVPLGTEIGTQIYIGFKLMITSVHCEGTINVDILSFLKKKEI